MPATPGASTWTRPGGVAFGEAALLLLAAVTAAGVLWAVRPDGPPLVADPRTYELDLAAPLIAVDEALALYDEGTHLFVDTRPVEPGTVATIPGALPIRAATFDDDLYALFDFLTVQDPLILFGDGDLLAASTIASRLADKGYRDLRILDGGLDAWRRAGGAIREPEEAGSCGGSGFSAAWRWAGCSSTPRWANSPIRRVSPWR